MSLEPLRTCPDAETLAARADGRLPTAQCDAIDAHLAECPDCYEAFTSAVRLAADAAPAAPSAHRLNGPRLYALVGALAASVIAAIWVGTVLWRDPDRLARRELAGFAAPSGDRRVALGRLSASDRWAPAPQSFRGTAATPSRDAREAQLRAEDLVARRRSPATLTALGVAHLAAGEIDRGISALEDASRIAPMSIDLRIAYSAALLERWRATATPDDAVRALDQATIASEQEPRNAAAWFNRALASEAAAPRTQAIAAWEQYLAIDPASPWATEARERLERLRRAAGSSGSAGTDLTAALRYRYLESEALPAWAEAVGRGASYPLTAALESAQALAATDNDRHLLTLLHAASDDRAGTPRTCLADAVLLHRQWRTEYDAARLEKAAALAADAEQRLRCAGAPTFPAEIARRLTALSRNDTTAAVADITALETAAMAAGSPRWAAQAAAIRGIVALRGGLFTDGLDHHRRSHALARRAGDSELVATAAAALANAYDEMGDASTAWRYRLEAFGLLDEIVSPRRQWVVLSTSAVDAADAEMPGVALVVADDLIARMTAGTNAAGIAFGHLVRARAHAMMGRPDDAARALTLGAETVATIDDPGVRAQFDAEVALTAGRVHLTRDPATAVTELTRGIDALGDNAFRSALLLILRGRAHMAAGRSPDAERDWLRAAVMVEDERAEVRDRQLRVSRFDEVWDVFGELTRFYADTPERALAMVERGHARELLDWMGGASPATAHETSWQTLPADLPALVYAALDDRLIVWRAAGGTLQTVTHAVSLAELTARVDAHVRAVSQGQPDPGALFDLLLPWPIAGASTIVFAPDGPLHRVAFSALRRPGASRALVEDAVPVITPSLHVLQQTLTRPPLPASPRAVLLGVDDAQRDEGLPALPFARREIEELVRLYGERAVALASPVDWARARAAIAEADVFHFAGHAVSDPALPARSRLVLGAADRRELAAPDLAAIALQPGAVVVLSACETAQGRVYRGEGPLSLARPFLARGAGTVIGTLWRVEDEDTAALMVEFHRRLTSGMPAATALADSQRQAIAGGSSARTWAAFSAVGLSAARR